MIWLSADLHLGHYNAIRHANRPFKTLEEMDTTLIENWRSKIKDDDTVYYLGDLCWKSPDKYLDKLTGKIHLILGNHDEHFRKYYENSRRFESIERLAIIKVNKMPVSLCHYPMLSWASSCHGALHFFGHCHGNRTHSGLAYDIGVDNNNYLPISLDDAIAILEEKRKTIGVKKQTILNMFRRFKRRIGL